MIIGIGTDLCDIRRIEKTLERFGDRFTDRIYTDLERTKAIRRDAPANRYAMFYAAKEACAKALGTGFREGVFWRDLGVENLPSGKPYMVLTGGALAKLNSLTPIGMTAQIDISLTDEYPMAHAMVVISAEPA
ncbi:MAG: holo-ACP synthase [Rhodospirillaceae bacterium]|jgi:holo-[acyl-carrier protein] synthase|nr:holo-ACP synthase [Rhodospirillales bacterium]MBT3907405.1 holo-ACP synthase [Rhodospirillaceae bacterium]MBT4701710.1 holo-ACP synthase [Rhodospirillaceae bacterium]MBT5035316.1 holo-ACP synthase [Rhodospirillaceae bacterium]MBT6221850.1 holo-ACP synthase [Rhodospirillaceae bacterium]